MPCSSGASPNQVQHAVAGIERGLRVLEHHLHAQGPGACVRAAQGGDGPAIPAHLAGRMVAGCRRASARACSCRTRSRRPGRPPRSSPPRDPRPRPHGPWQQGCPRQRASKPGGGPGKAARQGAGVQQGGPCRACQRMEATDEMLRPHFTQRGYLRAGRVGTGAARTEGAAIRQARQAWHQAGNLPQPLARLVARGHGRP